MRRAFADSDADVYLLTDGDDTYDATAAPKLIATLLCGPYDYVLCVRTDEPDASADRPGHAAGNRLCNRLIRTLVGEQVTDLLSTSVFH